MKRVAWLLVIGACLAAGAVGKGAPQDTTIVVVALYQKSHVIAMQALAEEMADRGYRVFFATTDDDAALVTRHPGVSFLSLGPPPAAPVAMTVFELFEGEAQYAEKLYPVATRALDALGVRPAVVLYHTLTPLGQALARYYGALEIAAAPDLHGVVVHGEEPLWHPHLLAPYTRAEMVAHYPTRLISCLVNLAFRVILPLYRGRATEGFFKSVGLPAVWTNRGFRVGYTVPLLLGSTVGIDLPRKLPPMIKQYGAFLPRNHETPLTPSLRAILAAAAAAGQRVAFISIGTNAIWSEHDVRAVLGGVLRNPEVLFIWSMRERQQIATNVTGWIAKKGIKNVRVEHFVPQYSLLAEPQVATFLTHGGLGSVQEALWFGKPVIVIPGCCDQFYVAARVKELGVGVQAHYNGANISDAVQRVLTDESILERAAQFSEFMRASKGRERAGDFVEQVVKFDVAQLLVESDATAASHVAWNLDLYGTLVAVLFVLVKVVSCCCCRRRRRQGQAGGKEKRH